MEYCAGGELFDMICQQNHFTEQQAVKVVTQVTEALDYLHSFGIVHRDIKVKKKQGVVFCYHFTGPPPPPGVRHADTQIPVNCDRIL